MAANTVIVNQEQSDIDEFRQTVHEVFAMMEDMLVRKRLSYGPGNLTKRGSLGIIIRTEDKLERLWKMAMTGETNTAVNESNLDAWRDIIGYGVLGLLYDTKG